MTSRALDKHMEHIENRPEVKQLREKLLQLEARFKARTTDEDWDLLLEWESYWAQYVSVIAEVMYPLAYRQGWAESQATISKVDFQSAGLQEKRVQVVFKYDDGVKIYDGLKITEHMALIRVHGERNLCICSLEATPDPELFLIGPSTEPLLEESDHLFLNMAKDMHELTFAQFAAQYEPVMRQMLFNA